jgi:tetratricopeptide (TPR) repeat protein
VNARALEYLKQLIEEESGNPNLSLDVALAHLQLAESLGNPGASSKGDVAGALENYRRAIDLLEQQLRTNPADSDVRFYVAHAYIGYSVVILARNVSMALQMQKKALAILSPDEGAADVIVRLEREQAYELIGEQYGDPYFANLGDTSRALENIQKASYLAELLHKAYPDDYGPRRQLYYCDIQIAAVLWAQGRNREALEFQQRGEAMLNSMSVQGIIGPQAPQSQILREELASAMTRRAGLLSDMGRLESAQAALQESRAMLESLFWNDSMNAGLRRDLTRNYNLTADTLARTGNLRRSLELYHQALALSAEILAAQPARQPFADDMADFRQQFADSYEGLGNTLLLSGERAGALENCKKALAIRQSLVKLDANNARYAFFLSRNYLSLAKILSKNRDRAGAIRNLRAALEIQQTLAAKDPANALVARDLSSTRQRLRDLNRR